MLCRQGVARGKKEAFVIITEGRVRVNGQKAISPAQMAEADARIEIKSNDEYVGRGALKLAGALDAFGIDPTDMICADIGCATGGFTQVLLRHGAKKAPSCLRLL